MGSRTVGFVAVAALVAAPVLAEKAFIPVSDGAAQRTEISLTNARGARAATVLAQIGYEAGGAGSRQQVTVGGGQSLRLTGLAGNGLVALDLPGGVKATATLVVERAGGQSVRASLPVLTQADYMPAGSNASLRNVGLPEDYRKIAVGAVNLSSRAMRCEARFEDADRELLAAPIGFTVAPFAERRASSFAGGKGRADLDTLNTLRCDQPFWTYALVEQPKTGDVKVLYPAKEVELAATQSVTTEATTLSYSIPGTFFVAGPSKWAYRYNMSFSYRSLKQIYTQFTVYHGGWDPEKPNGNHLVIWMQKAGWSTCLQFFNTVKAGFNKFRWIYGGGDTVGKAYYGLYPGKTYSVRTWWDGVNRKNGFRVEKGGVLTSTKQGTLGVGSVTTNKMFVQFANPNNCSLYGQTVGCDAEPDARSPGWKWSDFKIDLIN